MTERRGRWHPSPEQVELVLDCATARMPLEKAAKLCGVGPRTISIFAKRHGMTFPGRVAGSRTAEMRPPSPGRRFLMAVARPGSIRRRGERHRRPAGAGASLAPGIMARPWRGRIFIAGKNRHLGYYATKEEAKAAHAAAVQEHLGERYLKAEDRPA
jgi:hypothetical protein